MNQRKQAQQKKMTKHNHKLRNMAQSANYDKKYVNYENKQLLQEQEQQESRNQNMSDENEFIPLLITDNETEFQNKIIKINEELRDLMTISRVLS